MYLHIGKEYVINEEKIIGIFDIETIRNNKEYNDFFENIKNNLIDISDGAQKTLVFLKDKRSYVTNIASMTLRKRICNCRDRHYR